MSQPAHQMTQMGHLVAKIASVAYSADHLCYRFSPNEADIEHYELQLRLLRETVQRMGWLADLCAMEMGQATAIGYAAAWMAPPLFKHQAALAATP